jgi:hypothetical protein
MCVAAVAPSPTPPSAGKVRIIDRVKVPSPDPGRVGKFDYMITYIDEAMRAGVVTMWAEILDGKTDAEQERLIAERIKAEIAERVKWTGREISVR